MKDDTSHGGGNGLLKFFMRNEVTLFFPQPKEAREKKENRIIRYCKSYFIFHLVNLVATENVIMLDLQHVK